MPIIENLLKKYEKLQAVFKVFVLLVAIFLLIYWIHLFYTLHKQQNDAYSFLTEKAENNLSKEN